MPVETLSTRLQLSSSGATRGPLLAAPGQRGEPVGAAAPRPPRRGPRRPVQRDRVQHSRWRILCANPAIQNTLFDRLKGTILVRRDARSAPGSRRAALSAVEASALGALAKAFALFLCYPLVRLKVLRQAAQRKEPKHGSDSPSEGALTPRQYAGLLYRGLGAALSKNIVSAALMYSLKEKIARLVVAGLQRLLQRPALR
ncbi:unnamed protein product [Prorocentrum cordatum]|uniref:Uncharacterized protein n=1 Tax=Prorocentrum cordatum TaxID=2364126 RepID=A0ABN9YCE3_9DINO|nr:unnamed protein product [Polarella glacialis]